MIAAPGGFVKAVGKILRFFLCEDFRRGNQQALQGFCRRALLDHVGVNLHKVSGAGQPVGSVFRKSILGIDGDGMIHGRAAYQIRSLIGFAPTDKRVFPIQHGLVRNKNVKLKRFLALQGEKETAYAYGRG